ncbi:TIGR04086 family membrane protein [Sedimentibacter sp. zth1]|uniref:TIGR04086 family membrane protein n=1 Tax=Sedimentibacter sp. zth1 TaxID=2816908 RepID=UPI001A923583|nr:TIGR04086 family membrane protein [Sedimentibacter sp. zth1]QSX06325.1 TIGR04086 family membrane protein [Sedimentibacter sp. zth1]
MKITYLLKFSVLMMILILLMFLILSLITYFFESSKIVGYIYNFVAPICIFVVAFSYAMKCGERGLLRGLEVWAVYFIIISFLKFTVLEGANINMLKHLIFIPVGIIGGILGVNFHK